MIGSGWIFSIFSQLFCGVYYYSIESKRFDWIYTVSSIGYPYL